MKEELFELIAKGIATVIVSGFVLGISIIVGVWMYHLFIGWEIVTPICK